MKVHYRCFANRQAHIYKEGTTTKFISKIPTVWDETIILEAKVADYILIARRKDDMWYIGAMTDWTPRDFDIDFSFLEEGTYSMEVMSDGLNTDRFAQDYTYETMEIDNISNKKNKTGIRWWMGSHHFKKIKSISKLSSPLNPPYLSIVAGNSDL